MLLVEQHIIRKSDPRYTAIDQAAFASKNLYNLANYSVRQSFIFQNKYIPYPSLYKLMRDTEAYQSLPAKVSQWVLKQVDHDWQAFFAAIKQWKQSPQLFTGKPKLPKYKDKLAGRNLLTYTIQAISKPGLQKGIVKPSGLDIEINTDQTNINQVRITPRKGFYVVEVIYDRPPTPAKLNPHWAAGMDLGLDVLSALTSNKPGFQPLLVNGKPLKSINQFYNKRKAELQSRLTGNRHTSNRIEELSNKRNRRVRHYLHATSRQIVDYLVQEEIGVLVVGKNVAWKQEINMGRKNNQAFVSIPHAQLIDMLAYKCELVGIKLIVTEESYTSKCSFLDLEPVGKHDSYMGRRVKRGLFVSSTGKRIHADINGSYNMIRKVFPDAFGKGIVGLVVAPVRFSLLT
ncbi:MAG: RNA-guided endonuclease InsQ/TnpB family protein [Bacteroidales bacterium]